jgi:hypothetical protein
MKLEIELVPTPLWGESLNRLLTGAQWNKIRAPALERAAGHCEVCEAGTTRLQCHEQWSYDDSSGVRTLAGIKAVCGPCNSVIHIGRARKAAAQGQLDIQAVYDHFMKVNGIDWPTAQQAIRDAVQLHAERGNRSWTTDFGPYAAAVEERRANFPDGRIPIRKMTPYSRKSG